MDTTVQIFGVVPRRKIHRPFSDRFNAFKPYAGELRAVFGGSEHQLGIGVVVTNPGVAQSAASGGILKLPLFDYLHHNRFVHHITRSIKPVFACYPRPAFELMQLG